MTVQKYPYKVTKINWYDYISRGERAHTFSFEIEPPKMGTILEDIIVKGDILLMSTTTDDVYKVDYCKLRPSNIHPVIECEFSVPHDVPAGTYNVVVKAHKFNYFITVPTDVTLLSFTIIDNLGVPKSNNLTKMKREDLTYMEELEDENN